MLKKNLPEINKKIYSKFKKRKNEKKKLKKKKATIRMWRKKMIYFVFELISLGDISFALSVLGKIILLKFLKFMYLKFKFSKREFYLKLGFKF